MQNFNNNAEPKRFFLFRLSRPVRILIYLPIVAVILIFALRQLEFLVTYHPRPYTPGPRWTPPANGEDVWFRVANGERVHGWFLRTKQPPFAAGSPSKAPAGIVERALIVVSAMPANPSPRQRRLILGVGFNPRDPGQNPRVASATPENIQNSMNSRPIQASLTRRGGARACRGLKSPAKVSRR